MNMDGESDMLTEAMDDDDIAEADELIDISGEIDS